MSLLIVDPVEAQTWLDAKSAIEPRFTECWEGVTVVPPMANNPHQQLVMQLSYALSSVIDWEAGDKCLPGGNVSDYGEDWTFNYRCPDVIVYLAGNPAIDHDSHWEGGPDIALEILSRGENPEAKFEFYASIGTREVLIVDRKPWALELFRLKRGKLVSVGRSELPESSVLKSTVLPFTFQLKPGKPRPTIEMVHTTTGQVWKA
jgi:hypothetical protein